MAIKAVKILLPVKTVKRLFAAEGYLELGMPEYALRELAGIEDATPVEASVEFLTGEAFRQQERYDDAVKSLERAARLIPEPYNKVVWEALSDCFRKNGDEELADIAAIIASETGTEMDELNFDEADYDFERNDHYDEGPGEFDSDDDDDFGASDLFESDSDFEEDSAEEGPAPPLSDRWN
jgi:tetratricopeptide (TPR) repeat protein